LWRWRPSSTVRASGVPARTAAARAPPACAHLLALPPVPAAPGPLRPATRLPGPTPRALRARSPHRGLGLPELPQAVAPPARHVLLGQRPRRDGAPAPPCGRALPALRMRQGAAGKLANWACQGVPGYSDGCAPAHLAPLAPVRLKQYAAHLLLAPPPPHTHTHTRYK
jgi:hypothetical protein